MLVITDGDTESGWWRHQRRSQPGPRHPLAGRDDTLEMFTLKHYVLIFAYPHIVYMRIIFYPHIVYMRIKKMSYIYYSHIVCRNTIS